MQLKPAHDEHLDAQLAEWGRWRRQELAEVAPRNPLKGASWQRQISDREEWEEIGHRLDSAPDEETCLRIQRAYEELKRHKTGFEIVIRDVYVDGLGWPPLRLLRCARYLMWKYGA